MKEFLDSNCTGSPHIPKEEIESIAKHGYTIEQAQCYFFNYYDKYICEGFNGCCSNKCICDEISKLLRLNY